MNIKNGMITGLKAVWWAACIPPRAVRWVWKHKILSAAAAVALLWGYGKVKSEFESSAAPQKVVQQAQQKKKIVAPTLEDMEKAAAKAVEKKSLVSSPSKDLSAKSGDRQLPALDRLSALVEQGAKASSEPDKKGLHSILICDKTNLQNYALMHIGFHRNDDKGIGQFKLFHSVVVPEGSKMPEVSGMFNLSFDMPGMRMGIEPKGDSLVPTKYNMNATTLDVSKNSGRTLLLVNEKGGLDQVTDQAVIDMAFKEVPMTGKADVFGQGFKLYHDAGAYAHEVPQWQKELMQKNGGR